MITQVFISASHFDEETFGNGINIRITRCDSSDDDVELEIVDDGEKQIAAFSIDFNLLRKAIIRLNA